MQIDATYSPEDNKIRLYPSARLDSETFAKVKAAGFKWAPKQGLFVAPKWTPEREDLAIDMAGEIQPEEMTLAERAQAKAARLDDLAEKRANDAKGFARAAHELSESFAYGQPILIGHHSERKARKTQERMHNAADKAAEAARLSDYWLYRAEGVERHANRKNDPKVRARRIKTLLSDLRGVQRAINDSAKAFELWSKIEPTDNDAVMKLLNYSQLSGAPYGLWSDVRGGKVPHAEAHEKCLASAKRGMESSRRARFISHLLNRLAYEQSFMPDTPRFEGDLTAAILQTFARTHGAEKPEATKTDDGWIISSPVTLPLHLANDTDCEMSGDEWRDLMQAVGYTVPDKKPAKPPILNFKAGRLQAVPMYDKPNAREFEQVEMTSAEYKAIRSEAKWVEQSACGQFRFRVGPKPDFSGPYYQTPRVAVFLTDSKIHAAPDGFHNEEAA